MRCTSPRTVGWKADGCTITFSKNDYNKELATFKVPCGKCISCRLEYARQWSIRCVHEAQMHSENSFITLTYEDQNIKRLEYRHFQLFAKRLRKQINQRISIFVTGEYGEKPTLLPNGQMSVGHRPHWHALIFGWRPKDLIEKYKNKRGDQIYESKTLDTLWGLGIADLGQVTKESANYCARYSAKKLTHGHDLDHDFQPISKKSSKYAIGKKWLESYWTDAFNHGSIVLADGSTCAIPRYYEKWLQTHHPDEYHYYLMNVKTKKIDFATKASEKEAKAEKEINQVRRGSPQISRNEVNAIIAQSNLNILNQFNKL